ncbi:MAG: lipoprotein signal peptidase [Bacteroidia bacterium]|nr:lipoprotein signal peptidase [Bacteroidia bacterium]MDW8345968.1 lipoprotein signal peptidase [Bacteroidia bacterium]
MKKTFPYLVLALVLILVDQVTKIYVKTNFDIGEERKILGNFFKLHFIENPGMAFGMSFGTGTGKFLLSLFSILAVGGIVYFLIYAVKKNRPKGLAISVSCILGGAIGNIIDRVFYDVLFDNRGLVPDGKKEYMFGEVVDMFYFDIWHGEIGGVYISLWPIFNFADFCISVGVVSILVFQKRFLNTAKPTNQNTETLSNNSTNSSQTNPG